MRQRRSHGIKVYRGEFSREAAKTPRAFRPATPVREADILRAVLDLKQTTRILRGDAR